MNLVLTQLMRGMRAGTKLKKPKKTGETGFNRHRNIVITGCAGSGKTTTADWIQTGMQEDGILAVVIDQDDLRMMNISAIREVIARVDVVIVTCPTEGVAAAEKLFGPLVHVHINCSSAGRIHAQGEPRLKRGLELPEVPVMSEGK
jgi:signal recognition particle GTPase